MKKTLIKIDRWILDQLTIYIKRWIKKRDYKQHKIDFDIKVQNFETLFMAIFVMISPAVLLIMSERFLAGGFHIFIWSFSIGFRILRTQHTMTQIKQEHDIRFALRKNPEVYNMEKAVLEYVFLTMRKKRIGLAVTDFCISWFFSFGFLLMFLTSDSFFVVPYITIGIFFFISPFITCIHQYSFYVFDFDEPEEKKKVAKESVSEIVLRAWQNLIGGLAPQPNYG